MKAQLHLQLPPTISERESEGCWLATESEARERPGGQGVKPNSLSCLQTSGGPTGAGGGGPQAFPR